jgi:hypothetical protein
MRNCTRDEGGRSGSAIRCRSQATASCGWRLHAERLCRGPTVGLSRRGGRTALPGLHEHQNAIPAERLEQLEFLSEPKTKSR